MDWISSLLNALCPFCGYPVGDCSKACRSCSEQQLLTERSPVLWDIVDGINVASASPYNGWIRDLILSQKRGPKRVVLRWLASLVSSKIPEDWRDHPLVWLPGRPWEEEHLVEGLALELGKLGQRLSAFPWLLRKMGWAKPQKELTLEQRNERDMRKLYQLSKRKISESRCILLDDIVTTGSSLRGTRQILESRAEVQVLGALSLAYTLRKTSAPQDALQRVHDIVV